MANNIKFEKNALVVSFAEVKGKNVQNYEMYTNGIKALEEIGRVATLKIVEAIARVNVTSLWKLGNSEKTGMPYNSLNEWAITEFGYSKSHVSEMLSVAKMCCDPETGAPLASLAGYSYTQLLAFTKNPKLLTKVLNGEEVEGLSLSTTAKDIKTLGIEKKDDKQDDKQDDKKEEKKEEKQEDKKEEKHEKSDASPHSERTLTIKMEDLERWYSMITEGNTQSLLSEWDKVLGNPF